MSARSTAVEVLYALRSHSAWADAALAAALKKTHFSPEDKGLCTHLVYGVLQRQMLLDYDLAVFLSRPLASLQAPLAEILRVGAYQILFLDRVPDHAAVSESVTLAKEFRLGNASGLVNAVLRRLAREKDHLPPLPQDDALRARAIRFSHPEWLVERLEKRLGEQDCEALLAANNAPVPLSVHVNTLKTDPPSLQELWAQAGISSDQHPWMPEILLLRQPVGDPAHLPGFGEGLFFVQDAAAAAAAAFSGVESGARVLDVCAAPGGKSFAMAMIMGDRGEILSCDLHQNKLKRLDSGASRLGIRSIRSMAQDAKALPESLFESFDTVVADVPCSGLGIIRKKPDIRYKNPASFSALPGIQSAILERASHCVKPGGVLLYCTCTVLEEENEAVTAAFLKRNAAFSIEGSDALPGLVFAGQKTFWPHRDFSDGFFICRMRREN